MATHLNDSTLLSDVIFKYAKTKILRKPLRYEKLFESGDTLFVYLYHYYLLSTKCFNEEYIKKGYARYELSNNAEFNNEWSEYESEAREDEEGLWDDESIIPQFDEISSYGLIRYSNDLYPPSRSRSVVFFNLQYNYIFNANTFTISAIMLSEDERISNSLSGFILVPKANFDFTPFGLSIGAMISSNNKSNDLKFWLIPVAGVRLGSMERFHLFANLLSEDHLSVLDYGLTLKFKNTFNEVSFGSSYTISESALFINTKINVYENYLLEVMVHRYHEINQYSFLMGVGLIFE